MHPTPAANEEEYSSKYKRFVLVMLTLVYAFNFIDRQLLVILQEPIKAEMGLSDAQLGLLSGFTFALVYVLAGIPIAYWADRGNRRNIITAALAVWSGMTALSGLAANYTQLLWARVGVGLGEAGGSPPAHSMISDYYAPEHRGKALAFYSTGIYIGILFGFLFGGLIAVVGIPGVIFAVVLYLTVKEPQRGRWEANHNSTTHVTLRETLDLLRQRPAFWYMALGCAATAYAAYGNGNFFPSLLVRNHGMSIGDIGIVLAFSSGVCGAIGTFGGGYLADRFGTKDRRWYLWIPLIGCLAGFPPYVLSIWTDNTVLAVACIIIANLLATFYLGPCIALSHSMVGPGMRALTSAILFFVLNMIGLGMGPFITGLQSDLLQPAFGDQNLRYSMLITAQAKLVAVGCFYMAARKLPADLART